ALLLTEGMPSAQIFTVLSGLGLRYRSRGTGRRQAMSFVFPGDLIGLQSEAEGEMGHTVEARSRMRLCVFERTALWEIFRDAPRRAYDLTWRAADDAHMLGGAGDLDGPRTAERLVAWALVQVWTRAKALGLVDHGQTPLPFRQQDLADVLGLSLVHTNKTLAKFRHRRLATWRDGILVLSDPETLARIGLTSSDAPRSRRIL
ncbi:MAG: Crp/Fnr family transcriptional regulator, partial [Pseudomonadota bacterium]